MVWLVLIVVVSLFWAVSAWRGRNSRSRVVERGLSQVWAQLKTQHGMQEYYSGPQVAAAILASGVTEDIAPFAYARYCREQDFRASPGCAGHDYRKLREEMLDARRGRAGAGSPQHPGRI